jgi:hypothetical protein
VQVGDLVLYNYRTGRKDERQLGIVTDISAGVLCWWTPFDGSNPTWTHIVNLEVISESR